jgi:octaprenyl-diphosphate synthase
MPVSFIRDFLAADMKAVDSVIRSRLESQVSLVRKVAQYIVEGGGKRLRPALLLLSAGAFGYQGRHHYQLAAAIEFIHTATLLHDDVVDASEMRRGRSTANILFGNAASVLVGDFVYSRAFQMMVEIDSMRVMHVMAEATNVIAEGEVLQLMNSHNPDIDEQNYLQVIRYKTAKLFEASARLGAILGNATAEQEIAMARYGMHLGTAFQLIDDVLDYSGDHVATGKNIGDDLAEGKTTLPLIYAIEHGTKVEGALIKQAIEDGGLSEFPQVIAAVTRTGALQYARAQAEAEALIAAKALTVLGESKQRDYLLQLTNFAVSRDN